MPAKKSPMPMKPCDDKGKKPADGKKKPGFVPFKKGGK